MSSFSSFKQYYRCALCGYVTNVTNIHRSCPKAPKTEERAEPWASYKGKYAHASVLMYRILSEDSKEPDLKGGLYGVRDNYNALMELLGTAEQMKCKNLTYLKKAIKFFERYITEHDKEYGKALYKMSKEKVTK